ncbi:MAG TPA: NAD(P)-dependent oxidoreductase [Solirubrobacter sp.]|nr:NAD(P)-dependent oxidoreductase [Solirubrobacter sp.]
MRLLITGATGFVGSRLVEHLADRHDVYAIARRPPTGQLGSRATWIEQDLRAFDESALPDEVDGIVHLAQSALYREFPAGAPDVFAVNVGSTFSILEYARRAGARSVVLASTGGVYGYRRHPIRELEDEPRPTTFYFRSKRSAELLAEAYAELFSVVVFRFFFVYGAGQQRMLIPTLIEKVVSGDEIVIDGDPGLAINPIHVDDAVRAFEPALELGRSTTLNVAGNERVTITELVRLIGEIAGRRANITHRPAQPDGDLVADIGRLREVLGVSPEISLRDGLRDAIGVPSSQR